MTDSVSAVKPMPQFTTIKYTTKDGENITATKKDGVVTLSGDKNGVRQVPLEDFIKKELAENIASVKLENTPESDTVQIASKTVDASNVNVQASNADGVGKKLDVAA